MKNRFKKLGLGQLGLLALLAATSCSDFGQETPTTQANAKLVSSSTTAASEENDQRFLAEPLTPVIGVRWGSVGNEKSAISNELQLFVKNFTKIPLEVSLQVLFHGMLKYRATMDLENFNINPDEEVVFPVAAKDIPLQIVSGVGQISVNAVANIEKKSGNVQWIAPVSPIYYQHTADFRSVETFSQEVLLNEKNGVLSGVPEGKAQTAEVLGRLKNSNGEFSDIKSADLRVELVNSEGQSAGYITGMSIDVDQDME